MWLDQMLPPGTGIGPPHICASLHTLHIRVLEPERCPPPPLLLYINGQSPPFPFPFQTKHKPVSASISIYTQLSFFAKPLRKCLSSPSPSCPHHHGHGARSTVMEMTTTMMDTTMHRQLALKVMVMMMMMTGIMTMLLLHRWRVTTMEATIMLRLHE